MPPKCKTLAVRPRRADDEAFLLNLYATAGKGGLDEGNGSRDTDSDFLEIQSKARLDYPTRFPAAEFQIVVVDGEDSGQLIFNRTRDELVIVDILLVPERRNLGIGEAALRRILGEAAATRKPVRAVIFKGNRAARFFGRLGFAKVGETDLQLTMEWTAPEPVPPPKLLEDSLKLPLSFDPARLQEDLAGIMADEYVRHFNTAYFEGDWSGVPLRSVGGRANHIYADPTARNQFADTELLARCPYVRQVLATLACPQQSVRFLRLKPGSIIKEHRDYSLGFEDGEARLHIPVITNPGVEFVLNQVRVIMNEGECWFLNVNLPHRVANRGATDRIHLVIDCAVNDWLRELLLATNANAPRTS